MTPPSSWIPSQNDASGDTNDPKKNTKRMPAKHPFFVA
jgi:hypothetical protein